MGPFAKIRQAFRLRSAVSDFRREQEEAGHMPTAMDFLRDREAATAAYMDPENIAELEAAARRLAADPRVIGAGGVDTATQIERLTALRMNGTLTDEEFETAKQQVIGE